jgi:hypothetical protein
MIHARHRTEGHVFQRRYHAAPCTDPEYLRNAIAYVHLNPVRAGLSNLPDDYAWTTHDAYCSPAPTPPGARRGVGAGLELFSPFPGASVGETCTNYRTFLEWRVSADARHASASPQRRSELPHAPATAGGDIYWAERFGWSCTPLAERQRPRPPLLDLRDLGLRFLRGIEPEMTLDLLRSGDRSRTLVAVRRQFINRAKENGHRHRAIARFLNISDVTVSRS